MLWYITLLTIPAVVAVMFLLRTYRSETINL